MAANMSNRGDNMTEANLQADGLVEEPAQRAADLWGTEGEDSSPHNLPIWSPVQRPPTGHLNTNYCLSIQAILTDELGDVLPHLHTWTTPVIEDMLRETRAGLTEAVVIGPGRAILFYGRCSMGEGLKVDEARDATFLLTSAGTWVGKSAYLTADPMILQEGRRAIAWVKVRGLGHPRVNPPAQQPFRFNTSRASPPEDQSAHEVPKDRQTPQQPFHGQGHNRRRRDWRLWSPRLPSPLPDWGFESDGSSISMASSISSQSDHSDGSRHSRWGRRHQEETRMKINLPIFKDEDAKDTVTYQSWRWDLTVYRHAGCRDHTLLPYAIRSLQGYPGDLVWSSGTDITLNEVLTILDKHYNNVKALDALNQELFQMRMADKRQCWIGVSTSPNIYRYWQHPSLTDFPQNV